jgi:hypothetical protein
MTGGAHFLLWHQTHEEPFRIWTGTASPLDAVFGELVHLVAYNITRTDLARGLLFSKPGHLLSKPAR